MACRFGHLTPALPNVRLLLTALSMDAAGSLCSPVAIFSNAPQQKRGALGRSTRMAHPDLDNLMNALLPLAQQMLAKHGEFYPYGSTMRTDGKIIAQAAYDGNEHPPSQQLIDLMTQAFRAQAASGEIRAAGICYDVRTIPPGKTEKTDAICLGLEHQTGQCVSVFVPYKKGWLGKIQYGDLFATKRDAEFLSRPKKDTEGATGTFYLL